MPKSALIDTITRIAEPVVASLGLEIWGIEVLQGGRPVVRLYVDTPPAGGAAPRDEGQPVTLEDSDGSGESVSAESVSIDQCARISRMVGLALEVEDVFPSAYVLEVSSPGLSRVFFRVEQMAPYVGDTVDVVLYEAPSAWVGRKKFRGQLVSVEGDRLTLSVEAGAEQTDESCTQLVVAWDEVRKAARVHVFHVPEKPGHGKRSGAAK